jgi:hypothetical protein
MDRQLAHIGLYAAHDVSKYEAISSYALVSYVVLAMFSLSGPN